MENIRNLVSSIIVKDQENQEKYFEAAMREKINSALDARKIALADSLFNGKK
jgi:hypothetical protein